jgi:creatinine amidohydrolase
MRIERMTTEELRKALTRDPVVLLPIGATEAHGPHLPLGTDSLQPEAMADMLADRLGGLVAPPIRYGHHSSTRNMVGTLGVSFDTLRALVRDVLEALVSEGITKIVILSGHAGHVHMAALKVAVSEVLEKHDLKVMLLTDYDIAREIQGELGVPEDDGHGGMVETARVMALAPELVREPRGSGEFVDQRYMMIPNPEICYPQGFAGRADLATPELGRRINERIADIIESIVRERMGV